MCWDALIVHASTYERSTLINTRILALVGVAAVAAAGHTAQFVLDPTADTRILSIFPTSNDNSEFLATYTEAGNEQRTLIQYDYAPLAGQTIASATLRLFGESFSGSTAAVTEDIYRVGSAWSETQVTWKASSTGNNWANQGGDALGTTGTQLTNPFTHWSGNGTRTPQWFEFDVTSLVAGAVNGSFDNHGMLLVGNTGNQLAWVSREGHSFGNVPVNTPQLVVETQSVPEPVTTTALAGLLAAALRRKAKAQR